jgi:hypothetical protein
MAVLRVAELVNSRARELDAANGEKAYSKLLELRAELAKTLEELRSIEKRRPIYEFDFIRDANGFIQSVIAHPKDD